MFSFYHSRLNKTIFWLIIATLVFYYLPVFAKVPNDQDFSKQSVMWSQIGAPQAWNAATGTSRVVVALIDIGVDITHEDLTKNIWVNKDEIPNNGIDDDNNGYVDDINGWNFVENNNQVTVPNIGDIEDKGVASHGTMAAGLIGAQGNNDLAGAGVNWHVRIMPLRAIGNSGNGSFQTVAKAVDYAVDNGANVINLSVVGDSDDKKLKDSLERAYNKGIVLVAAAGNDRRSGDDKASLNTHQRYPICVDYNQTTNWLLGVSAVDSDDHLSNFANYGACVDLTAPGENIYSTLYYQPENNYSDQFGGNLKGTSFSVPLVAGSAGLVKSARPDWSAKDIMANLLNSADNIDNINTSFAGQIGKGRLNVFRAITNALLVAISPETLKTVYSFSDSNEVFSYDLLGSAFGKQSVARLYNTKIINLAAADINDDNNIEIILLIKRDIYYYIRILKADGALWREFPLSDNGAGLVYSKIGVYWTENKLGSLVVDLQGKDKNKIKFVNYQINGQKIKEQEVTKPLSWVVDREGKFFLSRLKNGQLTIEDLDWAGRNNYQWSLKGVEKLSDMQVGKIWGGERDEVIFLANQNNEVKMIVVDLASGSWFDKQIDKVKKGVDWRLVLGPYGEVVLPYNSAGGSYTVYNGKGKYLKDILLPKLEKQAWFVGAREW